VRTIDAAIERLRSVGTIVARSSTYRTLPWGVTDQPNFYNAAVLIDTTLEARTLLASLKQIEADLGRGAGERWGPRVIDLDILTYGSARVESAELTIPHPHLLERAFALAPLSEIDAVFREAYAALPQADRDGVERIF